MLSPQQGVDPQFLEVNDFGGGLTENPLGSLQSRYTTADNFYLLTIGEQTKLLTRPGLRVDDATNPRVPANARINKIFDVEQQMLQISSQKLYYNASGFTHVTGPTGNNAFNAGSAASVYSVAKWNKHGFMTNDSLPSIQKTFKNGATWYCHNLGLPRVASLPTITGTGSGRNFLYAFNYTYTYTSSSVTFSEQGQTLFSTTATTNTNDPATTPIAFTAIPVLTNGATENYDTANIKVNIYRTQNNGTVFYYVGQVTNGTTTFSDNVADTALINNAILYSAGSVPDHEIPPPAKYLTVVNDMLVLGHVKESGVTVPNRVRFSNRLSLWSCPSSFYEDFDETVKGVSAYNTYPIVFCDNKVYRIEGFYLPDGSGGTAKREISKVAGCQGSDSIVTTENGLYWAGNDGWYFTDGFKVVRISTELNFTYRSLYNRSRITGCYEPRYNYIVWTVQELSGSTDNDKIYCVLLDQGVNDSMPFTTWSGGYTRSNFAPATVYYLNNKIYMGDTNGYLLSFQDGVYDDTKIAVGTAVSTWTTLPIIYDYKSVSHNFGNVSVRKWVPYISLVADNVSSVSLQAYSINDNSGEQKALKEISYRGAVAWGDPGVAWADPSVRWNYFPIIATERRMPAGSLRCMYKQVRFTNSYSLIATSADFGIATFNGVANTAVLGANWIDGITDYYISTAADGYVTQFKILSQSTTTLTIEDINNVLPTGAYDWKIYGYRKGEVFRLVSYTIRYSFTSPSLDPYRASA